MIKQLQHVLENPRSLSARHELANYWIDIGDERGQFIYNLLREHERDLSVSLGELDREYFDLLKRHETDWKADALELVSSCDFRLGLVGSVSVSGEALAARGNQLLDIAPVIAFFIKPPFELQRVLGAGVLKNAVSLSFGETRDFEDGVAIAIAESTSLSELRILTLPEIGTVTSRGLQALATSKYLPNLISIEVTGNPCAQSGGVMRNDDRDYFICAAGESFLATAQRDMLLGSDPMVLHWPPLFDQYAWLP